MTRAHTVRRRLTPVFVVLVGMLLLTGVAATVNAVLSYRSVLRLTTDLQPAVSANNAVLQDMTDAETGVRGWGLSGEESALEPYREALERLPGDQEVLREYAADDPGVGRLVAKFEDAAQAWLDDYAVPRVNRPGGEGTFQQAAFDIGKARFDELRADHAQIQEVLEARAAEERSDAVRRVRRISAGVALFAAVGLLAALAARRRVTSEVEDPLEDLAEVVRQQAAGRHDVRAEVRGVEEIQLVARAFNDLADQHDRARAVEAEVQQEVRALDAARRDFVSNVSHELRTPLTTISGYVELVEDEFGGRLDPPYDGMLEATRRNVARLTRLIDDLLTLSRAENRHTDVEQLDLREIVEDVVGDLRMTASRRGVTLHLDLPAAPAAVLADRGQINRVFLNLVSNAVKFSHEGDDVDIAVVVDRDSVITTVTDHGIGIPAADLPSIGERFFRASNAVTGEVPGTGLGLRIVQTITENHGGHLDLASREGEGTTVTVTLPSHGE